MTECFERDDNTLQTESRTLYCQFVYQDTSKLECEPQEAQNFPSFFDFGQCGHVILWGSDGVRELSDLDGIILRGDLTMRQLTAGTNHNRPVRIDTAGREGDCIHTEASVLTLFRPSCEILFQEFCEVSKSKQEWRLCRGVRSPCRGLGHLEGKKWRKIYQECDVDG